MTLGIAADYPPVRGTTERTAPVADVPESVDDRRAPFSSQSEGRADGNDSEQGSCKAIDQMRAVSRADASDRPRPLGLTTCRHRRLCLRCPAPGPRACTQRTPWRSLRGSYEVPCEERSAIV